MGIVLTTLRTKRARTETAAAGVVAAAPRTRREVVTTRHRSPMMYVFVSLPNNARMTRLRWPFVPSEVTLAFCNTDTLPQELLVLIGRFLCLSPIEAL